MATYPNQKTVIVQKTPTEAEQVYCKFDKEGLFRAVQELTHNELKVYLYLASNKDGYRAGLSTADIAERTNANQRRVQSAVNGLIEKGYLIQLQNNEYLFCE